MRWTDIEDYFDQLIRTGRRNPRNGVGTELDSMRFATMCLALGLDPREGKIRVLHAMGKRRCAS